MTLLKTPQSSIGVALATAGMVYGLYSINVPSTAQIHATRPNDGNVSAGRKKAAITAGIATVGVAALTRDPNVFIVAGALLIMLDVGVRHANATNPDNQQLVSPDGAPAVMGVSQTAVQQ
jgi:hypothetical protein